MSKGKVTIVRPPDAEGVSVGEVVVVDRGLDALVDEIVSWRRLGVVVGIRGEAGAERDEDSGLTVAQYAAVNEFGSDDGHVPERSFIRSTIEDGRDHYINEMEHALNGAIDVTVASQTAGPGTAALRQSLGLLGVEAAGDVQAKIRDLRDPPNAPSTIARKSTSGQRSSNPLVDTGRMGRSVDSEVRGPGLGAA